MKIFIFAQLFVFSFAKTCDKPGQCVNSLFLGSISQSNQHDCHQFCQNTHGCEYVSFDDESKVCLLFEDCADISEKYCPTCRTTSNDCIECDIEGSCIVSSIVSSGIEDYLLFNFWSSLVFEFSINKSQNFHGFFSLLFQSLRYVVL